MIREPRPQDVEAICRIYNHYVAHTAVTFGTDPVPESEMIALIEAASAKFPWVVWEEEGRVWGYAVASEWKSRCAYRYSVETTIYLDPGAAGRGVGTRLYGDLLDRVNAAGHHSALGGIALPNPASVALHEKLGFVKVGHLKEVGWKFDRWVDVGYWQKIFG
ncbi:MAG: N-acetyltransferase family protein [Candidatus Krumholzibacteriota bacterium]